MNLLLPILFTATFIGLFARRVTWREWTIFVIVVLAAVIRYYNKGS